MGQGTRTIFPQLVAAELGIGEDDVDLAPVDTSIVPDSGPTVASRTAMVVGGLVVSGRARLREQVEAATGRPFAASAADYAREHGRDAHRAALRALSGHPLRRRHLYR